jgi:nitrous oxide reductase
VSALDICKCIVYEKYNDKLTFDDTYQLINKFVETHTLNVLWDLGVISNNLEFIPDSYNGDMAIAKATASITAVALNDITE